MLFQKRVVCTKLDIYIFIFIHYKFMATGISLSVDLHVMNEEY